jgi:ABC-2 type transport system ATP-binding protein
VSEHRSGEGREPALMVDGLERSFEDKPALDGLSFQVDRGEVVALLGPNGAGKTTAMRCVAGVLLPDAGRISIAGAPAGTVAAQAAISFLPEHPDLYPGLTIDEHLRFVALSHALTAWQPRAEALLERFALIEVRDQLPGALSQGMRRKAALSMALLHGAQVLMLDEPFNGLDPQAAAELREVVGDLAIQGVAVLVSTHGLTTADRIATRSVVMAAGRLVADGTTAELRTRAGVPGDADLEAVFLALTRSDRSV